MKENLDEKDIIFRIGYFRDKKNMTAYRLGVELGHSKQYFYRVQNGSIRLGIAEFLEVLRVLGVTTTEFFCPTLDKKDLELLEKIGKLSDAHKTTILDMIENLTK